VELGGLEPPTSCVRSHRRASVGFRADPRSAGHRRGGYGSLFCSTLPSPHAPARSTPVRDRGGRRLRRVLSVHRSRSRVTPVRGMARGTATGD